jgi:hypothetical protein
VLAALTDRDRAQPDLLRVLDRLTLVDDEDPAWMFALGYALHPTRPPLNLEDDDVEQTSAQDDD